MCPVVLFLLPFPGGPVRRQPDRVQSLDVFVAAPTPQGTAWLTLDSGAGGVSLIAKDYARAFGLDPDFKGQSLRSELAPVSR
jgi:hypothetical protein